MNLYFDNATTSFPKSDRMISSISDFYKEPVGSYGRSSDPHTLEIISHIETLRDDIASLMGGVDGENICFTDNATTAINTILKGVDRRNKKVLVSPMEHNAVMRCLTAFDIPYDVMPALSDGCIDFMMMNEMDPWDYSLIVVNHQSNVNGLIQPIEDVVQWSDGVPILLDATQSLGSIELDVDSWGIDYVAFTGHKALMGPSGTGGFFVRDPEKLIPLTVGGNGLRSEQLDLLEEMPDRFMAGTPNLLGLYGLSMSLKEPIVSAHHYWDVSSLISRLQDIEGITVYAANDPDQQGEVFSIAHDRISPSEMNDLLRMKYGIIARSGLHCAPLAHKTIGSFPNGTVRFSFSPFHTEEDFDFLYHAVEKIIYDL